MNEPQRGFDSLSLLVRIVGAAVVGTLWLAESLRKHDRTEAIAAIAISYVILPIIAYLHTRYYNSKFMGWIIEAVRRKGSGRTPS
jgi:nicotinamide riboside transporter PnuC